MTKTTLSIVMFSAMLALWPNAVPANAQPIRVFVAVTGSDGAPCTFVAPCKSVQHAHDVVAAGGEIRMLDPGSYGLLTITKSISILGDGHGGIAAQSGATAITINAGANDKINLRGLVLEGFGSGNNGIRFNTGASLNIQDCIIRNFHVHGVGFFPNASSKLSMSNTVVSVNGGDGILVEPTGSATTVGIFDHLEIDNNGGQGLEVNGKFATGGTAKVTISDSVIVNGAIGIDSLADPGATAVMVQSSTIANNTIGLEVNGTSGTLRVSRSTITGNTIGFEAAGGGTLESFGDNALRGNTANGAPTATVGLQ